MIVKTPFGVGKDRHTAFRAGALEGNAMLDSAPVKPTHVRHMVLLLAVLIYMITCIDLTIARCAGADIRLYRSFETGIASKRRRSQYSIPSCAR